MTYFEREDGTRVPLNLDEWAIEHALRSGKFIAIMRTTTVTVLRKAGRHMSKPVKPLHYGGRFNPRNPNGYRGN